MNCDELSGATRRAILKGVAGALGVAVAGTASAHPGAGDHGEEGHDHPAEDAAGTTWVGYHSLGGAGSTSIGGQPDDPHYGGISELKVQDGLAYVGILSSKAPTYDRGLAILDVTDYTNADGKTELEAAEPVLLSFLPNENNAVSVMDVKLSSDGEYAFICKQPIAVTFMDHEIQTDPENLGTSPESSSLQAVDVSDPDDPEVVGRWDAWGLGPHNSDHLRIGGTDYVFAVKGPTGENAGIYVVQFDRSSGHMQLVNYWTEDTNVAAGEFGDPSDDQYGTNGNELYMHDIAVERDPKTGRPLAYAANWNYGGLVLDVADPMDIRQLGHFDQNRCHEIWPATVTDPTTGDPRRVFVTGQENPDSSYGLEGHETGYVYVVDADDVFDLEPGEDANLGTASNLLEDDQDPDAVRTELGKWLLSGNYEYANYTLSSHNLDPFEALCPPDSDDARLRQFVALGHYHAGVRILEFTEALGGPSPPAYDDSFLREAPDDATGPEYNGDDGFGQVAYFRSHAEGVPDGAKMAGLTEATPDFWCAVQQNGVIFASGINTGLYGMTVGPDGDAPDAPDVGVGSGKPVDVEVERGEGADAFTAGQSERFELTVNHDAPGPIEVFDRVPASWDVFENAGDVENVHDVGDGTLVDLGAVSSGDTVTYFVEVGEETGTSTVGEVLYSTDGLGFHSVAGTVDSNAVVGASTNV